MLHIVVLEPSPFRRDETFVMGPYPWWKAVLVAWWETQKNPFSQAMVVNAAASIFHGEKVLW
jgi:hypothetical protein